MELSVISLTPESEVRKPVKVASTLYIPSPLVVKFRYPTVSPALG